MNGGEHDEPRRILLDEDFSDDILRELLEEAGFEAVRVIDVDDLGEGTPDPIVIDYAIQNDFRILTQNHKEYIHLYPSAYPAMRAFVNLQAGRLTPAQVVHIVRVIYIYEEHLLQQPYVVLTNYRHLLDVGIDA